MAALKKIREVNLKMRLLKDLGNLVVSSSVKFEGCAPKIVGGVGFFRVTVVFKKSRKVGTFMIPTSNLANGTTIYLGCYIKSFKKVGIVF